MSHFLFSKLFKLSFVTLYTVIESFTSFSSVALEHNLHCCCCRQWPGLAVAVIYFNLTLM